MYKIDEKIKIWKNKLFDKTRNNEMLNVKTNKKKYVVIEEPSINEIYDKIVINDKSLSFKEKITMDKNPRVFKTMSLMTKLGYPMDAYKGDILGVSIDDLDKTLYNLRKDTEHYKNEFGVDILHLSFGYIIWKLNKDDMELSSTPLINVPVHLERKNINSPYIITKIGDPILNPALLYVLKDYKITLPPFDINKKIEEYFELLEPIARENNWNLIKSVGLNILKYQKIAMFVDLDNPGNVERIKNHKLLMAMSGDIPYEGISEEEMNEITNSQDEKSELDRILVLDADSSQLDALALADKGHSFVLFGPPGTGKSQTITNLIASALYKGKKVLFVAQKLAALEVVYNKLKQTRLSDFCLLLHDVKTKKKEVIEKIYKPLENIDRTEVTDEAINKLKELEELKKSINQYFKSTHEKILPIEQTLFELLNHYYDLMEVEDLNYSINDVLNVSKVKIEEVINNIKKFEIEYTSYLEHPHDKWINTNLTSISLGEKRLLEEELNILDDEIEKIFLAFNEINHFIPEINLYIREYYQYFEPLTKIFNTSIKHPNLFNKDYINQNIKLIERQIELNNLMLDNKNKINKYFNHQIYKYNLIEFTNNFKKDINDIRNHIPYYALRDDDNLLTTITKYISFVKLYQKNIEDLKHVTQLIKTTFKLSDDDLLNNDFKKILAIIKNNNYHFKVHNTIKEHKNEFIKDLEIICSYLDNKKLAYNELINIYGIDKTNNILSYDKEEVFNYYQILNTTKGLNKIFNKEYKKLVKELKTLFNIKKKKIILLSFDYLYKYHYHHKLIKEEIDKLNNKYHYLLFDEDTNYHEMLELANNSFELLKIIDFENDEAFVRYLSSTNKEYLIKTIEQYISINDSISECEVETTISKDSLDLDIILSDIVKEYQDVEKLFNKYTNIFNNFDDRFNIAKYFDLLVTYQKNIDEFEENKNKLSKYVEEQNDYAVLLEIAKDIKQYYELVNHFGFNEENINKILFNETKKSVILENNEYLKNNLINVEMKITKLNQKFKNTDFVSMPLDQLFNDIVELNSTIDGLVAYLNYQNYRKSITDEMTLTFVEKIENSSYSHELDRIFLKNFYYEVIENYIFNNSYLNKITKHKIINEIDQFKKKCKQQLTISQSRIRSEIMKRIPRMDGIITEKDSRAILRKEHSKKTRIMPLRKLFDTIPDLLMELQPCIMMSPIAVSSFLENDKYDFDLVIFDEASQIFPEDAIGTIYRGKQVIIAGDSNQLPPTSFFSKIGSDEFAEDLDDSDYADEETGESILDLATNSLINCSLKWHYRSKDERLIAFSNQKIYDNKLITFPTNYTTLPDYGVEFEYVTGGIYANKGNVVEALRIVELIERHINLFPEKSLGVIAFSKKQQNCIEKEVNKFRKEHLEYEFFFNSDKEEPFFVKNLENVQGDERDVILFSIGYAKGDDGILRHNFGPLQIAGGERRLNVAISRSKLNIKVVSSIRGIDINTKKAKSKGAILLKEYLNFAEDNSTLIEERTMSVEEMVSKQRLQKDIASFLTEQGFLVQTDYGYSNFKVDIAILDKEDERNIICGILLDGRYYENDNTCRGREYLKQNILENNGWKIHRIWSYFWYKQNELEKEKLLNILNGEDLSEIDEVEEVELITEKEAKTLEKASEYREYQFYKFVKMANPNMYIVNAILVRNIVSIEQPIHVDRIVEMICEQYGFDSRLIRPKVETYINTPAYKKDGKFVYFDANLLTKPRKNVYEKRLKFEHIYPGEIKAVMFDIIKNSFGLTRDDLMKSVILIFGYKVLSPKIKTLLSEIIDELIDYSLVAEIEGILSIKG